MIRDDFIVGQMAEPGVELFALTDESRLWVEARVDPEFAAQLRIGANAHVLVETHRSTARSSRYTTHWMKQPAHWRFDLEIQNPGRPCIPVGSTARIQTGESGETALEIAAGCRLAAVPTGIAAGPPWKWRPGVNPKRWNSSGKFQEG